MSTAPTLEAIKYVRGSLQLLDQRKLPSEFTYINIVDSAAGFVAIRDMNVRGAPAIAITAALSLAVECETARAEWEKLQPSELVSVLVEKLAHLNTSRPTAVNLANEVSKLTAFLHSMVANGSEMAQSSANVLTAYVEMAESLLVADVEDNLAIGRHGADAVLHDCGCQAEGEKLAMLTVCNTGSLATARYGTALGVIRRLHELGRLSRVFCCETRPYNQGSRLTAFELVYEQIPATLIVDSAAASLLASGRVHAVVAGADRVTANGDTANKIGTLPLAVLAKHFGAKFYIAAPFSTLDVSTPTGANIKIEERAPTEVTHDRAGRVAAEGIDVWNPVFDVTPAALIDGIITEHGVITKSTQQTTMDIPSFVATHKNARPSHEQAGL